MTASSCILSWGENSHLPVGPSYFLVAEVGAAALHSLLSSAALVGLAEDCRGPWFIPMWQHGCWKKTQREWRWHSSIRLSREDQLLKVKVKSFLSLLVDLPSIELCSRLCPRPSTWNSCSLPGSGWLLVGTSLPQ
jgi:hypothetical protein